MSARWIMIGFVALAAASAATACNEHNGVRPQADSPEWRVATADRGKLTAPVTVEYRWLEKPDRRTPGKLDLRVSSRAESGELAFEVRGSGGVHVVSNRPEQQRRKLAEGPVESEYRVEAAAGDGSVAVTATVTAGGRSLTRVVTIPLPGRAGPAEKPVETDADGERIRSMPAEDGPETSDER